MRAPLLISMTISNNQTGDYQFTTIDTIAPTITSFSPADDVTEIAVARDITVTFSEAIKRAAGDIYTQNIRWDSGCNL